MRLTVEENEYLISKFLLVLTEFAGDEREMFLINSIHDKAVADMNYRLPSLISRERKRRVIELLKEGTRIIKDFSGYAGDMGMINEYDRLKKENRNRPRSAWRRRRSTSGSRRSYKKRT